MIIVTMKIFIKLKEIDDLETASRQDQGSSVIDKQIDILHVI